MSKKSERERMGGTEGATFSPPQIVALGRGAEKGKNPDGPSSEYDEDL